MSKYLIIILFLLSINSVIAQEQDYITVVGDSLVGKTISGETIREVYGNVVLTQGDVKITCNKAIQYISKNNAELIGNVIAKQDSLTITTEHGFYYGDEKKAESDTGVTLDDKKVILTAKVGEYFFDADKAFFRDSVTLYDTTTTLTSDTLYYYKKENKAIAVSKVKIVDQDNIINADSLVHFRESRETIADNNVRIRNKSNNVIIFGNHLEDYSDRNYSLINENPLLMQIDTTYLKSDSLQVDSLTQDSLQSNIRLDTLIIRSKIMEAHRDTSNIFIARDSVEIWRGEFASKNDLTIYYRTDEKIITAKVNRQAPQPIIWYENSQLTGDSVTIFLRDNKIKLLQVDTDAFILSHSEEFPQRFDQISGRRVNINFDESGISSTEVEGSVYSIYYVYEDSLGNGLIKSSSQSAKINFVDKKVNSVKLYGSPNSEYYPEKMVEGNELSYLLPEYNFYTNRPTKKMLLKNYSEFNSAITDKKENGNNNFKK